MAQQIPPAALPLPSCYRELYTMESYQAEEPDPARLLASYRFVEAQGGGERPTPANLVEQTFALSERRSMTFLCLLRTHGTGVEVRVLHRMIRYLELPRADGRGLIDISLGLLGDISAAQAPAVAVDNGHFSLVGNAGVRVPTLATMRDHLDTAPPGGYIGPFGAEVPNTEVVRPRITQVIPCKYAATLVHREGVSPATAFLELQGIFEAEDVVAQCADVLTWLRVACTARGGAGELAPIPAVAQHFPLLLMPGAVSTYVASKLDRDLPGRQGRQAPAPTDGAGGDTLAAAIRLLAEKADGERPPREPKSVAEVYRETHPVLQRFCQVENVEGLAPIWGRLARGSKGELQSILQQELIKVCTGRGLTPDVYSPAVTSKLKQLVTSLNFVGNGPDDIASGCQPFLVTYTGADDHYRALDQATVAEQLDRGSTNASLADIREIREKERVKMPQDLNQVLYTLRRYAILVHTLFQGPGATNPFVESMWRLSNVFNDRLPVYLGEHQKLRGTVWYHVFPSHVIRYVQVSVHEYLHELQSSNIGSPPPPPTFVELHRSLQRGSFHTSAEWLPLPVAVTVDIASATLTPQGAAALATRNALAASAASAASVVSGLTATTTSDTTRGGRTATTSAGTYVLNPARDAEFDALTLRPGMRQLLQTNPPPRNDSNNEFCVSWWGRGGCYTNCGRAATHRPFANAGERERLLTHVRTHLTTDSPSAATRPAAASTRA
jgi:hypothetical protein